MNVRAVAFVPAAPILVSRLAGGAAPVDEPLRAACRAVIREVLAAGPDTVVVVAASPQPGSWPGEARWDFGGFGVPRLGGGNGPTLPWPLGVGAWWLDECGWTGDRSYVGVDARGMTPEPDVGAPAVVLAIGDGSACRTERAPGHFDDRAEGFDASVAAALAGGSPDGLRDLDRTVAAELLCGGWAAWQFTAEAVKGSEVTKAELVVASAPYGVGYFAAYWLLG
jgi:hypothetical protein